MKQIILASQSPRRKELLEKCGYPFITEPADIDETLNPSLSLQGAIKDLAARKAEHIFEKHPDAIVIGSDTIVTIDDEVLGKPKDDAHAFTMLRKLQGRTHEVITGIAIFSNEEKWTDVSISKVTFSPMSDEEIKTYIATKECNDKAGAYAIQEYGGRYITHIEGDYYSIMGLPLSKVYGQLKKKYAVSDTEK